MTDNYCWSVSAGRWMGVPVRIHMLTFLFLAVIFGVEWHYRHAFNGLLIGTGTVTTFVVMISILFHELAHVFAATNLGGHVNNIILTPWGGNSDLAVPDSHRSRAIVYFAGPFASGMICAICSVLLVQAGRVEFAELVNPLHPHRFQSNDGGASALMIIAWCNFQLAIVNMIPCFPFDGSALMRSLIGWINPELPRLRSESTIMVIGHAVAFTMIGMAWIIKDYDTGAIQPAWFLLILGGIALFFAARYSFHIETTNSDVDWDELDDLEYESMYNETSFFESVGDEDKTYSQWLQEKQLARQAEDERIEKEEERRADEILEKLHADGIAAITEEEKSLLHRVSERIRKRREQGVQ